MQVLTSAKARSFAETLWGRGGTTAYRTNRRGAYYFSCSGHGGYVVGGGVLTEAERAEIDKYVKPELTAVAIVNETGKIRFFHNPVSTRRRVSRWYPHTDTIFNEYPIYFFEEDCDWSVLEKFTNIRAGGKNTDPAHIDKIFDTWCKHRA